MLHKDSWQKLNAGPFDEFGVADRAAHCLGFVADTPKPSVWWRRKPACTDMPGPHPERWSLAQLCLLPVWMSLSAGFWP